ncbi:hypothetical protein H257_05589 [Aphanomyces astaci]|uniref:Uncharacterized protein n=1 Tax=Aphanomyces astaci TaxID=112090 RepID=W4GSY4_APHAT|nr:hypothetical protein H257_05589 [Aphanomyces astaci]ETV82074.1 hypothetical protein H257_05589 [Aphanomyces astaci]|eukprot:XP_009828811.1 hypothetical protein H257_05589 [Aphanomyces astaci]
MSLHSTSAPSFVGTPLNESRPLVYAIWKRNFLSQAIIRNVVGYFTEPNHDPYGIHREAIKIGKEPIVRPDIKVYMSAILAKSMDRKSAKAFAAQRFFAHTLLVSGMSTNLRHLYPKTTCLNTLFELLKTRFESNAMDNNPTVIATHLPNLKFTEDSCIDTLAVELNDLVKRYRGPMTMPTFNPLDAYAISSIDYDTYIWTYHTLCAMSDAFIVEKNLSGKSSRTVFRLPELPGAHRC